MRPAETPSDVVICPEIKSLPILLERRVAVVHRSGPGAVNSDSF